ncbi:hypothetical protein GCM10010346_57690 [Streptomyces chryseus]|uniref:Uncharacterized protein n=1 Tax=Streptomyces chryseus TaxID=68186 RepID=A0ABQ3E5E7_9ACTN|nr:hypothetical protein GCM10010346_57690 [Streptomyces chryseus]
MCTITVPSARRSTSTRTAERLGRAPIRLKDAGLGETGFDLGTAGQDVGRRLVVGGEVAFAVDRSAAQNDGVTVGVEAQQIR